MVSKIKVMVLLKQTNSNCRQSVWFFVKTNGKAVLNPERAK